MAFSGIRRRMHRLARWTVQAIVIVLGVVTAGIVTTLVLVVVSALR